MRYPRLIVLATIILILITLLIARSRPSSYVPDKLLGFNESHAQALFCRLLTINQIPKIDDVQVTVDGARRWSMKVYRANDSLSAAILRKGTWRPDLTDAIISKLQTVSKFRGADSDPAALIDIGTHLGWFTLSAAAAGFPVFSFEPLQTNEILLRTTLCDNPALAPLVAFFPHPLGASETSAIAMSPDSDLGSASMDPDALARSPDSPLALQRPQSGRLRHPVTLRRLDDIFLTHAARTPQLRTTYGLRGFAAPVGVVRIAARGSEHAVLDGAKAFIASAEVPYVYTEFVPSWVGGAVKARAYLEAWVALGYELRAAGWDGVVVEETRLAEFVDEAERRWKEDGVRGEAFLIRKRWIEEGRRKEGQEFEKAKGGWGKVRRGGLRIE
ncbi:hypothetical protein BJ742DRAFT_289900 [Cladochytrium replicatum]|nr:hypothetical protein BJ742DRAFT_289900 [Cladochytrium replicatum]